MVLSIFLSVILPVLLMIGAGVGLQRLYPMHIPTLSKLNIWIFVPAFLFVKLFESTLTFTEIGGIAVGVLIPMGLLAAPIWLTLKKTSVEGATTAAILIGAVVYNAGNFGLPVAELLYQSQGAIFPGMGEAGNGAAVQALVVMMSNLIIWCLGYIVLALAKGDGVKVALGYFKLPMIYVVIAAFALREFEVTLPTWIDYPLDTTAAGLIPVALITLGAQLGERFRMPKLRYVGPVVLLKLLVMPAVAAGSLWLTTFLPWKALHLWPWPGAQLAIAAAAPTAVNTLLLTLELEGDAELAADIVFWTTVCSALSASAVIGLVVHFAGMG